MYLKPAVQLRNIVTSVIRLCFLSDYTPSIQPLELILRKSQLKKWLCADKKLSGTLIWKIPRRQWWKSIYFLGFPCFGSKTKKKTWLFLNLLLKPWNHASDSLSSSMKQNTSSVPSLGKAQLKKQGLVKCHGAGIVSFWIDFPLTLRINRKRSTVRGEWTKMSNCSLERGGKWFNVTPATTTWVKENSNPLEKAACAESNTLFNPHGWIPLQAS